MFEEFPWILMALAGAIIVVIAIGLFFRKNQQSSGGRIFDAIHKPTFLIQFTLGILCSLGGAFLMFNGTLLGENTTGIAEVIGIIGIFLIATASTVGMAVKRKTW